MKKTNNFSYFTQSGKDEEKKKENLKKIWKWIKMVLYALLFGLTITGCVQSFALKNSSSVGNSIEFYLNDNQVAPRVNTLVERKQDTNINYIDNDGKTIKDAQKDQTFSVPVSVLSVNSDINTLVNNRDILQKLKEQTERNDGKYAEPKQYYTAFALDVKKETAERLGYKLAVAYTEKEHASYGLITNKEESQFLYRANTSKKYEYFNNIQNIVLLDFPSSANDKTIRLKTHKANGTNTNINDVDANKNFTLLSFSGLQSIPKYEGTATFKDKTGNEKTIKLLNVQFARDILQTLYNYSFGPNSAFVNKLNESVLRENKENEAGYNTFSDYLIFLGKKLQAQQDIEKIQQLKQDVSYNIELLNADQQTQFKNELKQANNNESQLQTLLNKVKEEFNKLSDDQKTKNLAKVTKPVDIQPQGIKISQVEKSLIEVYQQTMQEYLSQVGLINKADLRKFDATSTIKRASKSEAEKYNWQKNILIHLGNNNKQNIYDINMPMRGDYPSQPITNWGEAWKYGPFYGLLVYPLAALTQAMRQAIPDWYGWGSIIVIVIALVITRFLMFLVTFKSKVTQSVQEGLRSKKAAIEAKYAGFEKNKAMKMKKNQEIQALYSKYNINPMDQFGSLLLTMPVFLAMWRVIQGIPEIKQTVWLGLNFSSLSWSKIMSGEFIYAWILILTIAIQVLSQILPKLLDRRKFKRATTVSEAQALKKSERTQKIMVIVFAVITVLFSVGVQVYWLFGGLWQILEVLFLHRLKKTKWFKNKYSKRMLKATT
ncbi:YidC/Oxa1 family membrane protein insertase [Mycoplasmopsis mustelae]|uniref:YidC/Oxa1 family membrane protein insertase n=1 Tax=Mycoplasmopsis mustelae TaxID=171289 RepID=A0A4R7UDB9_9BACT|nr:YidC/Oxa1 family membrane protein insertase [Mycoplasmopsis mustelae]TDV24482.1 YidC/Oxa1 family membrane protein insertase [Mycoplasmopsis mustelae]